MKRFKNPFPNGGMPFQNEDWNTAQGEPLKAAQSIIAGLQEPCIISGGEITTISPKITMNGGYCFLNGKIMEFDPITDTPYGYLIEGAPTNEARTALDSSTVSDFTTTYKAVYSATPATGGDESIVLNATPYQYLNQVQFRQSTPKGTVVMLSAGTSDLFGFSIANFVAATNGEGAGWYKGFSIANGQNGATLDLTDRFVRPEVNEGNVGFTGGQNTVDTRHKHKHLSTGGDDGSSFSFDSGGSVTQIYSPQDVGGTGATVSKNTVQNTDFYTETAGNAAQDNMPAYYTLYYMQRI